MKPLKRTAKNAAEKLVTEMVKADFLRWLPGCIGFYYQPQRPLVPEQLKKDKK